MYQIYQRLHQQSIVQRHESRASLQLPTLVLDRQCLRQDQRSQDQQCNTERPPITLTSSNDTERSTATATATSRPSVPDLSLKRKTSAVNFAKEIADGTKQTREKLSVLKKKSSDKQAAILASPAGIKKSLKDDTPRSSSSGVIKKPVSTRSFPKLNVTIASDESE
jgi:hypothetical protein